MPSSGRRSRFYYHRALTLLEALVASVLLGVGVVGLMSAATLAMRNQNRCQHRTSALYLAQEKFAAIEVVGPHIWMLGHPTKGEEVRGDVVYDWEVEIDQQAVGELFSVKIKVSWTSGGGSGTVELETWLNDYEAKTQEAPEPRPEAAPQAEAPSRG